MAEVTREVTIDNITYHTSYREPPSTTSPSSAPLVLLVHALMADHTMYTSTTTALLNAGYRTLTYDHINHGLSPAPDPPLLTGPLLHFDNMTRHMLSPAPDPSILTGPLFHFDNMTRHMRSLVLSITGSEKVHAIIGCSMGGVLALRYAMLYPFSVTKIIAIGAPGLKALDAAKPLWTQRIEVLEKDKKAATTVLAEQTVQRWLPGTEERSVKARDQALEMTKRCGLLGYKVCADAIRDYDYLDELGGIKARCLVLVGERDTAVGPPEVLEDVAARIPRAEYVMMQGVGHLPPVHWPEEFERVALGFLEGER